MNALNAVHLLEQKMPVLPAKSIVISAPDDDASVLQASFASKNTTTYAASDRSILEETPQAQTLLSDYAEANTRYQHYVQQTRNMFATAGNYGDTDSHPSPSNQFVYDGIQSIDRVMRHVQAVQTHLQGAQQHREAWSIAEKSGHIQEAELSRRNLESSQQWMAFEMMQIEEALDDYMLLGEAAGTMADSESLFNDWNQLTYNSHVSYAQLRNMLDAGTEEDWRLWLEHGIDFQSRQHDTDVLATAGEFARNMVREITRLDKQKYALDQQEILYAQQQSSIPATDPHMAELRYHLDEASKDYIYDSDATRRMMDGIRDWAADHTVEGHLEASFSYEWQKLHHYRHATDITLNKAYLSLVETEDGMRSRLLSASS